MTTVEQTALFFLLSLALAEKDLVRKRVVGQEVLARSLLRIRPIVIEAPEQQSSYLLRLLLSSPEFGVPQLTSDNIGQLYWSTGMLPPLPAGKK